MPIDPFRDELLTFAQAAERLPRHRQGKAVHVTTLWRWATHGLRGVRLETIKVGGCPYTTRRALRDFFAALSATEEHRSTCARHASDEFNETVERELSRRFQI